MMAHMRLLLLAALACLLEFSLLAEQTMLQPIDPDRQEAFLRPRGVAHLGSGFATHAALAGDLLAVAPTPGASAGQRPRAGMVDLYRLGSDGAPEYFITLYS